MDGLLPLEGEHAGLVGPCERSIPRLGGIDVSVAMYHDVGAHQ